MQPICLMSLLDPDQSDAAVFSGERTRQLRDTDARYELPRYLRAPWDIDESDPQARARRTLVLGILASLVLHALLLFVAFQQRTLNDGNPAAATQGPLAVRIARAAPPPPAAAPEPPKPQPRPAPRRERIIALRTPVPGSMVLPMEPPEEKPPEKPPEPTPAPVAPALDMMALLNARRQQRRETEDSATRENNAAASTGREPSANDIAMATIQRNLASALGKAGGTSGVFEILHKGVRTAQFAFRGWKSDAGNSWREVIEVDAGLNGDVELAIIRKMIELIRKHYSGDFNWDSRRLGRVVVLSARLEDTASLEGFMMKEFFEIDPRAARMR
jgi:hypothetical protein